MITCKEVAAFAAEEFMVSIGEVMGTRRYFPITRVRQVAMYVSRQATRKSYPIIGRAFSRDHTTVLHSVNLIASLIKTDGGLNARVQRVLERATAAVKARRDDYFRQQYVTLATRLTTSEVCDLFDINRGTLRRRVLAGEMPRPIVDGNPALYDRDEIYMRVLA